MSGRMGGALRFHAREHEGPSPHKRTMKERIATGERLKKRRARKTAKKRTYRRHLH